MARHDTNKLLGIVMIILGVLLVVGTIGIPFSTEIVGVALIVVAVLMWIGTLGGTKGMAIVVGIVGLLLVLTPLPFIGPVIGAIGRVLDLVVGILLIVFGVTRLR